MYLQAWSMIINNFFSETRFASRAALDKWLPIKWYFCKVHCLRIVQDGGRVAQKMIINNNNGRGKT